MDINTFLRLQNKGDTFWTKVFLFGQKRTWNHLGNTVFAARGKSNKIILGEPFFVCGHKLAWWFRYGSSAYCFRLQILNVFATRYHFWVQISSHYPKYVQEFEVNINFSPNIFLSKKCLPLDFSSDELRKNVILFSIWFIVAVGIIWKRIHFVDKSVPFLAIYATLKRIWETLFSLPEEKATILSWGNPFLFAVINLLGDSDIDLRHMFSACKFSMFLGSDISIFWVQILSHYPKSVQKFEVNIISTSKNLLPVDFSGKGEGWSDLSAVTFRRRVSGYQFPRPRWKRSVLRCLP